MKPGDIVVRAVDHSAILWHDVELCGRTRAWKMRRPVSSVKGMALVIGIPNRQAIDTTDAVLILSEGRVGWAWLTHLQVHR